MNLGIDGRVALVAGGTSGLGLAVGRVLSEEGAAVALCGRRHDLAMSEAAKFGRGYGIELDLRNAESIARAVDQVEDKLGPIDILVLSGGGPPPSFAASLDLEAARDASELLLFGPIALVKKCVPSMESRKWGRVVAIGSSAVHQPIPGLATSTMFRAALASYLKLLAEEVARHGVTVNMVLPGRIATARTAELDAARAKRTGRQVSEIAKEVARGIPVGRYGAPEEFAALATYLCADSARYITGEQLRVDGGMVRAI